MRFSISGAIIAARVLPDTAQMKRHRFSATMKT
jgi:hypothetical protein